MPPTRILITAGPTFEPIDAVRYIGNRSSGRMGVAIADAACALDWSVTLLLGPTPLTPADTRARTLRFRTATDLEALLLAHLPHADLLIMAAAVADYRPKPNPAMSGGKFRRSSGPITLELEPTPDLLAAAARLRRPDQLLVGFALEPRQDLAASALAKLTRKKVDAIVANPLDTMDADTVEAFLLWADGSRTDTPGTMTKHDFAPWLLRQLAPRLPQRA